MRSVDPTLHATLRARAAAHEHQSHRDAAALAEPFGLLPIYLDWIGFFGLRLDGSMAFVGWDPPHELEMRIEPQMQRVALVAAAEHYPELLFLVPTRPLGAVVCPGCHGEGRPAYEGRALPENIRCMCGGVGWVLPEEIKDPSRP